MIRATVDAAALGAALRAGVAQPKGTLPVLGHALVEADAEGLRITTTDLQTLVATRVDATAESFGSVCARADLLAAAMVGGGVVELAEETGHLLVKRKPRSRVRIETLPADNWPIPLAMKWKPAGLDTKEFTRAVNAVAYAAARNDVRYYLNGICVGTDMVVCSDGRRMALADVRYGGQSFIVPIEAAQALRRALAEGGDIELGGVYEKEHTTLAIANDRERVEIQLVKQHNLPEFRRAVPNTEPAGQFNVAAAALRETVKRIRPFCETRLNVNGKLALSFGAGVRLQDGAAWIESGDRENRDDIPAAAMGEYAGAIDSAVDVTYLAGFIDAIDAERIRVEYHDFNDGTFVLRAAGEENPVTHCISRMRL